LGTRILEKAVIADGICRFIIEAPEIAKKLKAGNFVVIRAAGRPDQPLPRLAFLSAQGRRRRLQ
jgi:hypothetical protein